VTFQDRDSRQTNFANSSATFVTNTTGNIYIKPEMSDDDTWVYNASLIETADPANTGIGVWSDSTAIGNQGLRMYQESASLIANLTDAQDKAYIMVNRYLDSKMRAMNLVIYPDASPTNLYPKVLGYDISTRITLELNNADNQLALGSTGKQYHIEGIQHDWSMTGSTPNLWKTKWQLWDVNQYFILDAVHTDSVYREGLATNYAAVHNSAVGDNTRADASTQYIKNWKKDPVTFEIERAVVYYDLANVHGTSIKSARFGYYVADKSNSTPDFSAEIVSGAGVSQPLNVSDYAVLANAVASYGSIANNDIVTLQYNYIELNTNGLAYINTCIGGNCALALRTSGDINSSPPDSSTAEKQDFSGLTGGAIPRLIVGVEL
jgi:hypothetical protein